MAKCIMVQGTSSNVGKSLISAGLCRIFANAGYKTAPFKSQNMALNSYITKDGFEIGRAQAVQAECAYQHIDVRFNPILLKPTGNKTSQIIINGEVYGNMTASEYFAEKHKFIKYVKESYESLNKEYDVIVIEGAGSPAEINLNHKSIYNMRQLQKISSLAAKNKINKDKNHNNNNYCNGNISHCLQKPFLHFIFYDFYCNITD